MNVVDEAIHAAIREAGVLRERTRKKNTPQVRGAERDIIRATSLAWFNNHRKQLAGVLSDEDLVEVDTLYKHVMESSFKNALRANYVSTLKKIGDALVTLRSDNVIKLSTAGQPAPVTTADTPPDFSPLIQDTEMQAILQRRWLECGFCLGANAPLAATVMMGGLLEGLLLARVNSLSDAAPVFTAKAAPKDKLGKTHPLKDWTLQNYIAVAHELKWISQTVKDVGEVLRDYRNYIHPQKEFSEKISLSTDDAIILWQISKNIARQVLQTELHKS
jgi:hypothetical protein